MIGQANPVAQPKLPPPGVYEQEFAYWPWGGLLEQAAELVAGFAPRDAYVIDYMCGTGFLLERIRVRRPDLALEGCDTSATYVHFARERYPRVHVACADARELRPPRSPAIVVCTAGLHHLDRHDQPQFIAKVAAELQPGGYFVIGEELIGGFRDERERRRAVIGMCSALLEYIVDAGAPVSVIEAATDVLCNDLLERGEYKVSEAGLRALLKGTFVIDTFDRIWPSETSPFGDVLIACRRL
jgi:SAM-dependent methyltransferase